MIPINLPVPTDNASPQEIARLLRQFIADANRWRYGRFTFTATAYVIGAAAGATFTVSSGIKNIKAGMAVALSLPASPTWPTTLAIGGAWCPADNQIAFRVVNVDSIANTLTNTWVMRYIAVDPNDVPLEGSLSVP